MASSREDGHDDINLETPKPVDPEPPKPVDLEPPKPVELVSFSPGKIIPSEKAQVLPEGHVKKFVALLRDGKIQNVDRSAQSSSVSVEFLKINTWFEWLQTCINAASLSITTDGEGVLGFVLGLNPSTPATSTTSPIFCFTSAGVSAALGLAPSFSSSGPGAASGLPGNGETLIFGLDPLSSSPNLEMTLPEVFAFAGLHELAMVLPFLKDEKLQLARELKSATNESHRNAIWFEPKNSYKTVIRLQFTVPLDKIHTFFTERLLMEDEGLPKNAGDASNKLGPIDAAYIVVKKTMRELGWQPDRKRFSKQVNLALVAKCKILLKTGASIGFSVALTFNPSSFDFDLVPGPGSFNNVLIWLAAIAKIDDFESQLDTVKNSLGIEGFEITRILLTFATGHFKPIYIRLELKVVHQNATLLFSWSWTSGVGGKVRAELWPRSLMSTLTLDNQKLNPSWEEYLVYNDLDSTPLDLTGFFKKDTNALTDPPSEVGGHMSHLVFEVGGGEIALYGRLKLGTQQSDFSFDSITFSGRYKWKEPKQIDISFAVSCSLQGKHDQTPAYMTGEIRYATVRPGTSLWTLNASIENLSISSLEKFLGGTSSNEIMKFIGKLQIVTLDITYTFPSSFSSEGILRLGDLELDLKFTHEKDSCEFEAKLRPTANESTIGKILESITGSALVLPPFVSDIKLDGAGGAEIATVRLSKNATELFFVASFHIDPLKFTFLQYRRAGSTVIKRVIKVSAELPQFAIPMIDHSVQPFGELFFLWVHARAEDTAPAGLTEAEVNDINAKLEDPGFLVFKKTTDKKDAAVIAEGSHFVLIAAETRAVTIDYVFQKSATFKEPSTPTDGGKQDEDKGGGKEKEEEKEEEEDALEIPEAPGETHMAVYKKSVGPLSISNIGLQYKDNVLSVHVDAELLLGPIGLSLLGLTITANLNGEFNLQNISIKQIEVSLDGMAVSFDQSPIEIAGLFKRTENEAEESYAGGLIVGFEPYRFSAAGIYTKTKGDHGFKSVFVFGKLEGPLVILEFAEISGITGGFGYNIDLKLPQVTEVLQFPFLANIPSDPQGALTTMTNGGFFKPSEGSFWVAAGLKVKAFQALTIDAVVVVGWNPYVSLGIFGVAVVDVPKLESKAAKLLHIELGFAATVDLRSGVMKFEGQLTQNSFILSPDCHLTGGFAIYYWFAAADEAQANAELEGDWVVTIGGYHRQFIPPAHYPKPPPRLGISWKVSKSISIIGEAYFAITPKVCMGGVHLHATLSLGPLEAYFDAHADFLINYDPFHFTAQIGVTVGVKYTLDVWFVSTHISVELDAQLRLEGPPFSGTLYVDFYILGFSIDFGPGAAKVEKANLERFYQLVIQDDGTKAKADGDHVIGCLSGVMASGPENDAPKDWNVRAGDFSFRIACRFPIKFAIIDSDDSRIPDSTNSCIPESMDIYAKPMERTKPLSSTMRIDIKKVGADSKMLEWNVAPVVKKVPSALWGIYDSSNDPMKKNDPTTLLNADNPTVPLTMGVTISTPDPLLPMENSLPFDPAKQKPENAFPEDGNYPNFPGPSRVNTQWHPDEPLTEVVEERVIMAKGQWDAVSTRWKDSTKNQETVEHWINAFSWKAKLKAKAPDQLIKNFGKLYMAPPMLTVG